MKIYFKSTLLSIMLFALSGCFATRYVPPDIKPPVLKEVVYDLPYTVVSSAIVKTLQNGKVPFSEVTGVDGEKVVRTDDIDGDPGYFSCGRYRKGLHTYSTTYIKAVYVFTMKSIDDNRSSLTVKISGVSRWNNQPDIWELGDNIDIERPCVSNGTGEEFFYRSVLKNSQR